MKKSIAFIESNTTGTGQLFLQVARQKEFKPIFLTHDPTRYPFLEKEWIHPHIIDTNDLDSIVSVLKNVKNLSAVMSTSEYYIDISAHSAQYFGLPHNPIEVIRACRNKSKLAEKLFLLKLPIPKTTLISSIYHLNSLLVKIEYPLVVKPNIGSGSVGVRLINNQLELMEYCQVFFQTNQELLLQSYIPGEEFSVETLSDGNRIHIVGITKKHLTPPPFFVETGHDFPANISANLAETIQLTVKTALQGIGFTIGPAHTEVRVLDGIPYIIEINPRLAGGMIPEIIRAATNINLISAVIDLYVANTLVFPKPLTRYSSIRFIIPPRSGFFVANCDLIDKKNPDLHSLHITKNCETLQLLGDFRDRIGYVITKSISSQQAVKSAEKILSEISIDIDSQSDKCTSNYLADTGRLQASLDSRALSILAMDFPNKDELLYELDLMTRIDEAHALMLLKQKILTDIEVADLLDVITRLKETQFSSLMNREMPRGIYLSYEHELARLCTTQVGKKIHTARSRNDINATIFRLKSVKFLENIYSELWKLRSTILQKAQYSTATPFPLYSQYQTALPANFGYYLVAVENALARTQQAQKVLSIYLNRCPLGAGAGGGTSFNIDCELTARYLGFLDGVDIALDMIASRDFALRFLAEINTLGMTLSRLTKDLQLWTTNEFGFLRLPDSLTGGSSMMAQKKNPYLLEKIQGKCARLTSYYNAAITSMLKVPFSNSVEVGTEAVSEVSKAIEVAIAAMQLLSLIIANIEVDQEKTQYSMKHYLTIATYATDILIRDQGYSFKEAHYKIGQIISQSLETKSSPFDAIYSLIEGSSGTNQIPLNWAEVMEFGGGPGKRNTQLLLNIAENRMVEDAEWLLSWQQRWQVANQNRQENIKKILTASKT